MLEEPDIQVSEIADCLRREYGLNIAQVDFLPLGADINTAVYRAATDTTPYFVKLRSGGFNETAILVPKLLYDEGIGQVIAPLHTVSGQLWASLEQFKLMVFPFVEGRNGYEVNLPDHHWVELGHTLKALHTVELPLEFRERVQREDYSVVWRERVREFLVLAENAAFADPVAAELAELLRLKQPVIDELVNRAEQLAGVLQAQSRPFVLCHADIHAGNVLITANDAFYVVDWDTLILAPKERDLMFPGGGLFGNWRAPQEEETLFYQGYGFAQIDQNALAYYRCERVVQDIAAYCEQILMTDEGGEDRQEGLQQLTEQFHPGFVIDIALNTKPYLS